MLSFLLGAPSPTPGDGADPPYWTDKLEAWSTLGGAIVALLAAAATIWLLIHQIGETRRARAEAQQERTDAAEDRELARQDRELAAAERRDAEKAQARTVILTTEVGSLRDGDRRIMRIVDLRVTYTDLAGRRWVRAAGDSEPTRLFLPFENKRSS